MLASATATSIAVVGLVVALVTAGFASIQARHLAMPVKSRTWRRRE